jgi:ABC-type cobalamin/Fe3+-siderophores transport system ATPase subunit
MAWSGEHRAVIVEEFIINGRYPTWEANKLKTKQDMANIFLFLASTQNAVLNQRQNADTQR